ncbi:MAG: saccharopine dehydrogenase family protein [Acidimicrobiia bacterium]
MSAPILIAGLGAVGANAARQLVDTPSVTRVYVTDGRRERIEQVMGALASPKVAAADMRDLPDDVEVVACALPEDRDLPLAEFAVERGCAFTSAAEDADAIVQVLALHAAAEDAGARLVPGAGFAPGFSDVLAAHAASSFDQIDEIHVARVGTAGAASAAVMRHALRNRAAVAHRGVLHEVRPRGHELIWFPEPIGARDCTLVASGVALLAQAFPQAERIDTRLAEMTAPPWMRRTPDEQWGAVRVECWGRQGSVEAPLIYGCVERTAVAAGMMLALSAAAVIGALDLQRRDVPYAGVFGVGQLLDPIPTLAECARRGLKAAVFEGLEQVGARA